MIENIKYLSVCGDIHGSLANLVYKIVVERDYKDTAVIICGDFGAGFININYEYQNVKNRLEKNNVVLYALRGNHDDPKYFEKEETYSKDRLIFMEDYKVYDIAGYKVLPIGGACSTDITSSKRVEGRDYWKDEDVKRIDFKTLPVNVDVIVSHEAPDIFDPVSSESTLKEIFNTKEDEYENILNCRKYLTEIAYRVKTNYWFYGHYHKSYSGTFKNILWKCLGVKIRFDNSTPEIFDVPEKDLPIQGKEEE